MLTPSTPSGALVASMVQLMVPRLLVLVAVLGHLPLPSQLLALPSEPQLVTQQSSTLPLALHSLAQQLLALSPLSLQQSEVQP